MDMHPGLSISVTGLSAQQFNLANISQNLANVNTTSYKKATSVFSDLPYQKMRQPGGATSATSELPSGLMLGTGVRVGSTQKDFTQGQDTISNRSLDVAIHGQGFFQVQQSDGTVAYTRHGGFQQNATSGALVTSEGLPVLPSITIPSNALNVNISADGIVSIVQQGATASTQVGTLQLASFATPEGLEPIGGNLYIATNSSGTATLSTPGINGVGTLRQGALEASNVNIVEELVNMIQSQRAYEMNGKAIEAADGMLKFAAQML
jgi:flagellar basal-body rod protein FlgG